MHRDAFHVVEVTTGAFEQRVIAGFAIAPIFVLELLYVAFATVAYVVCAIDLLSSRVKALWRRLQAAPASNDLRIPAASPAA